MIARLGGWKGYESKRHPGITTLWIGLKYFKQQWMDGKYEEMCPHDSIDIGIGTDGNDIALLQPEMSATVANKKMFRAAVNNDLPLQIVFSNCQRRFAITKCLQLSSATVCDYKCFMNNRQRRFAIEQCVEQPSEYNMAF